jgi:predicted  nucleic acid-binding Zn-ribbon protein
MTASAQLYELQVLDLHIDAFNKQLADVETRLKDDHELVGATSQVASLQDSAKGIRPQYRQAELLAQESLFKVAEADKWLYSGSVRNPRELQSLEDDLKQLRRTQGTAEDRQLELMSQLEEAEQTLASAENYLQRIETAWARLVGTLEAERGRLSAELEAARGQREPVVSGIDARLLSHYDRLRISRSGQAVVLLERGACQGCRLVVPTGEVSRVRSSTEPVQCNSCGRILYVE